MLPQMKHPQHRDHHQDDKIHSIDQHHHHLIMLFRLQQKFTVTIRPMQKVKTRAQMAHKYTHIHTHTRTQYTRIIYAISLGQKKNHINMKKTLFFSCF